MPPSVPENCRAALRRLVARWRNPAARRPARRPRVPAATLLIAVGIVALLYALDEPITRSVAHLPPSLIVIARRITDFGTSLYMYVLAVTVVVAGIVVQRRGAGRKVDAGAGVLAERAAYVFGAVVLAGVTAQIVKHLLGRARPRLIDTLGPHHFQLIASQASMSSFPSGHAANAFAAAVAIGLLWPRGRPWLLAAAALVGVSRVLVHAHYASDVAAGAILGTACAVGLGFVLAHRRIALASSPEGLAPRARRVVRAALDRLPLIRPSRTFSPRAGRRDPPPSP